MNINLEKAELQLGIAHIQSMLKHKPCDNFMIIKHTYRVKSSTYFDYDLFKFAFPDDDNRQVQRLECSYFLEQLLRWFGHPHATQQKHEKITLWENITGESLYTGNILESTISLKKFFSVVGFFIYGNIYGNISHKFDTNKKAKLNMIATLGEECFFLIADYLDEKYGEVYNQGGKLPAPKEDKLNMTNEIITKFENFLATNPKITSETIIQDHNYSVSAFVLDFESSHKATYAWAVDYLVLEILAVLGYPKQSTLNALKANVQIPEKATIISEVKFYQLFGCCVILIAQAHNQEFKLCTLRRLGKICFAKLVSYLENP